MDREYRVLAALQNTDVPVPRVLLYCDDESIIGTPFYVMEFVSGRCFKDVALSDLRSPLERCRWRWHSGAVGAGCCCSGAGLRGECVVRNSCHGAPGQPAVLDISGCFHVLSRAVKEWE